MNLFIVRFYVLLQLLVDLVFVVSYTVVLKPVKPLYPSLKVYRYELRHPKILADPGGQYFYPKPGPAQRLYPVAVKQARDPSFRTRAPGKKDKRKSALKAPSATEKPLPRDQRLYGLPQQLVPPVSNQIEEYSETREEEARGQDNDIRHLFAATQDEKSFPSFGQEKGKIYSKPGDWATPAPSTDQGNETQPVFTPSQLYLQIRHKNTVIHVPQTEALNDAETLEELINAPRLKELARTTHVQEVYSEEGYEDAGYDHAGHIRNAQHGEIYDAKDEGKFRIKEPPVIIDYDSDLEESKKVKSIKNGAEEKPEPRITRAHSSAAKTPKSYKGGHKFSSRVKTPLAQNEDLRGLNFTGQHGLSPPQPTFPSYFGEVPSSILVNESFAALELPKKSSKYRKGDFNSTKIYPVPEATVQSDDYTNFKPYISLIDSQASPSAKSLKYSRIYSKKTKQLRLEPYKTGKVYEPPPEDEEQLSRGEEEPINERIVLPTIGYINSLTTAHFGKGGSGPVQEEPKTQLTSALDLNQALDYLRTNKNPKPTEPPAESDIRTFEPMRLKKPRTGFRPFKAKRDVYLVREWDMRAEEDYEGNDESDEPHNEKNEEIAEDERKRIEEENREKEKYEMELREEISKKEKEILNETLKNLGVRDDISEVFPEFPESGGPESRDPEPSASETTDAPVDPVKYPFYFSRRLPENSALRYATDPRKFPRKSGHKMEFYESRESYIQCPDFHPDLENLPDSNSTEYSEEQAGENQRLIGVGDKILCLRMKYFDREPFDNPIFKEKEIDYVGKPKKRMKNLKKKISSFQTRAESRPKTNRKPFETKKVESTRKNGSFGAIVGGQTAKGATPVKISAYPKPPIDLELASVPTVKKLSPVDYLEKTLQIRARPPKQHATDPNRITLPRDCLPIISKLAVLDGNKNVTVDCNDATLVQEATNGVVHLRIIPKNRKTTTHRPPRDNFYDGNDWVPIPGYVLPRNNHKKSNRKTDQVTVTKNETSSGSDHYVIDELKEDENVRKGEVVEDMDHYLALIDEMTKETTPEIDIETQNATRRKREEPKKQKTTLLDVFGKVDFDFITQNQVNTTEQDEDAGNRTLIRPFEYRRPLTRLSGRDFLIRYHKNKGKPKSLEKTADFWKIATPNPATSENAFKTLNKPPDFEKPTTGTVPEKPPETTTTKQPDEPRKTSSLIPEKVTKKSEIRQASEFRKTTTPIPLEQSQNFTKIITKVSRETSESSEKPLVVHKKSGNASEATKYKIINRNLERREFEEASRRYIASTDGPILYYIVDGKTGRGKWITNYEDRRRLSGKLRKARKFNNRSKTDKRGKNKKNNS